MEITIQHCEYDTALETTDCVATTTAYNDDPATSSLIFENRVRPDNILIIGLLIFIAMTIFSTFLLDILGSKKIRIEKK